jgi:hypothetical protein
MLSPFLHLLFLAALAGPLHRINDRLSLQRSFTTGEGLATAAQSLGKILNDALVPFMGKGHRIGTAAGGTFCANACFPAI